MATPEQLARAHYRDRARLVRAVAAEARRLWRQVDRDAVRGSWRSLAGRLLVLLAGAQLAAARQADAYAGAVLAAQGLDVEPAGLVVPSALSGVASDGRDLTTLLDRPVISTLTALGSGAPPVRALAAGYATLDMAVRTQVADAGRVADQVAVTARGVGYVRMLNPPSCSRCAVLAGRFYRWNQGFRRHPRCDCIHVPSREDTAEDLRTDPRAYFESLGRAEQDRIFTQAGAESIRLGADIGQVVNARRGAAGLTPAGARITAEEAQALRGGREVGRLTPIDVFGRPVLVTTEGTTTRGLAGVRLGARETGLKTAGQRYRSARAPRLMPESILHIADGNRDEAIRLLRRFGYIR